MRHFANPLIAQAASVALLAYGLLGSTANAAETKAPSNSGAKSAAPATQAPASKTEPAAGSAEKPAEQKAQAPQAQASKKSAQDSASPSTAAAKPTEAPATAPAPTEATAPTGTSTTAPTAAQFGVVKMAPDVIKPESTNVTPELSRPEPEREKYKLVIENNQSTKDTKEPEEVSIPADIRHLGNFQSHWQVSLGVRVAWVADPALDPFADSDEIPQATAGAGRTLLTDGRFSLMGMVYLDKGARSASIRGEHSSLDFVRISLGPELRYHLIPRSYVFVRIAPGYTVAKAEIEDATTAAKLVDWNAAFGGDLSGGLAFSVFGRDNLDPQARFWIGAEGGYGFAKLDTFRFKPKNADAVPLRFERPTLDALSFAGPFMRVSAIATF